MRVKVIDVRETHVNHPECRMRLAMDPKGKLYCVDCGCELIWTTVHALDRDLEREDLYYQAELSSFVAEMEGSPKVERPGVFAQEIDVKVPVGIDVDCIQCPCFRPERKNAYFQCDHPQAPWSADKMFSLNPLSPLDPIRAPSGCPRRETEKRPYWAGKDVVGVLLRKGWKIAKGGMMRGSLFIDEKEIIECGDIPDEGAKKLEEVAVQTKGPESE